MNMNSDPSSLLEPAFSELSLSPGFVSLSGSSGIPSSPETEAQDPVLPPNLFSGLFGSPAADSAGSSHAWSPAAAGSDSAYGESGAGGRLSSPWNTTVTQSPAEGLLAVGAEMEIDDFWKDQGLDLKSIWSARQNDQKPGPKKQSVKEKAKGPRRQVAALEAPRMMLDAPRMTPEVEKGGRLKMDEIYNQLEELETERRGYGAVLGIPSVKPKETPRAPFTVEGLTELLSQVRRHLVLFREYMTVGQAKREAGMQTRGQLTSSEFLLKAAELIEDKEVGFSAAHGFPIVVAQLYAEWESLINDVQNILTPAGSFSASAPNIGVTPFFLKQLGETIRESRMAAFMVFIHHQEATDGAFNAHLQ